MKLDAINNAVTLVSEISVLRNKIDGVHDQVDILKHQFHKLKGRLTVMEENREGPIKSDHPTQPTPHVSTGVRKDPIKNDRPDNKTDSVSRPQAKKCTPSQPQEYTLQYRQETHQGGTKLRAPPGSPGRFFHKVSDVVDKFVSNHPPSPSRTITRPSHHTGRGLGQYTADSEFEATDYCEPEGTLYPPSEQEFESPYVDGAQKHQNRGRPSNRQRNNGRGQYRRKSPPPLRWPHPMVSQRMIV